ncbi:MAG: LysE family translocator [Rhodopseudomonas sp.]|nr:LysE family translocator [Rhodopseudomonas sp.]
MPVDIFLALLVFACAMSFTPGPNNILLAASGVNFGFTRTIPHMMGVTLGFFVLLASCAAGLGLVFAAVPALHVALKVAGAVYMLYLAYKVSTAHLANEGQAPARPITFLQAAAFQWVNPKAVLAAVSAIAIFVRPDHQSFDIPLMLLAFTIATAGSVLTWSAFGVALRGLLKDPSHARIFNIAMALLLVASIVPMVRAS